MAIEIKREWIDAVTRDIYEAIKDLRGDNVPERAKSIIDLYIRSLLFEAGIDVK
jgi:hypothetical protein